MRVTRAETEPFSRASSLTGGFVACGIFDDVCRPVFFFSMELAAGLVFLNGVYFRINLIVSLWTISA